MFQYTEYKPKKSKLPLVLILGTLAVIIAVGVFFVLNSSDKSIKLDGNAMSPTLPKGSTIKIQPATNYKSGDIIVFSDPQQPATKHTRRIVAVGGETVQISGGRLLVNGLSQDEPYVKESANKDFNAQVVPSGYVFVLGDNRNNSQDSRDFGVVPLSNILGVVK